MTRSRIFTFIFVLAVSGVGLTVLMAARAANDKAENPPSPGATTETKARLVFLGDVDTEDRMAYLFPRNYPQPSRVTAVKVKQGEEVVKGQPLLEFDNDIYNQKIQEAEIGIKAAEFTVQSAEGKVRMHKVTVDALEKELKGKEAELVDKQYALQSAKDSLSVRGGERLTLNSAEAAVKAAEFNLDSAKIKLEGLRGESPTYLVEEAKQAIAHKKNLKRQAETALEQVSCPAPADGRIIRINATEGMTFGPTTREPAFWFLKKAPLIIRGQVAQEFAAKVKKGMVAEIKDEADKSQLWKGKVIKVGDQFLPKRGGSNLMDIVPVNDDSVMECIISIEVAEGQAGPKYGQKVRVFLE